LAQVTLKNITKTFANFPVLDDINLDIKDGEFMVLVGPSGCGKSTLLRLISGLETLSDGEIFIGDRLINRLAPKARDIAMVFQSYALYPHLSVYNNLAFGLRRTRPPQSKAAIEKRVQSVAQMLQIEALLTRLPKQLSGGQKQRVALGRAMARDPQVFLMDEPLSNLDAKLRTETRAQIVSLQRQLDTTTIYVTHDQTEAMTMGDRIAVMNQGKLQQVAPPLDLYRAPANKFVAAFIGSPPMNFLPVTAKVSSDSVQVVHSEFAIALPLEWKDALSSYNNQTLTLGIRPEHVAIGQTPNSVPVTVMQMEALGSETFVVGELQSALLPSTQQSQTLQIRLSADYAIDDKSTLQVTFPPQKIHLFDPEDNAIRPQKS